MAYHIIVWIPCIPQIIVPSDFSTR